MSLNMENMPAREVLCEILRQSPVPASYHLTHNYRPALLGGPLIPYQASLSLNFYNPRGRLCQRFQGPPYEFSPEEKKWWRDELAILAEEMRSRKFE